MNRIIKLKEPKEQLKGCLEWADTERAAAADAGVEQDVTYFRQYRQALSGWAKKLEDGVSEKALIKVAEPDGSIPETDGLHESDSEQGSIPWAARRDAARHVLAKVFDYSVRLEKVVRARNPGDGHIHLIDETGKTVQVPIEGKEDALASADAFLREVGYSINDAQQTATTSSPPNDRSETEHRQQS